jgi:signal transduction histidine kinase
MNKNQDFNLNIDSNIGFISIDKIQFTQVINNLLTNAVKFSNKKNKIINLACFIKNKHIFIEIEDS